MHLRILLVLVYKNNSFYGHHFDFSDGTKLSKRQGDIQISYFQVSTLYFGKDTYMYIYPCVSMCDIHVIL